MNLQTETKKLKKKKNKLVTVILRCVRTAELGSDRVAVIIKPGWRRSSNSTVNKFVSI
jgi:hypothetical protein